MSDGMGIGGRRGMGGHHKTIGATDEWWTPPALFDALGLEFDLDPCAPEWPRAHWIPAKRRVSLPDDGLSVEWAGRVWLNPPYGPRTQHWMRRLAGHGDGIALVFARTDTSWFHDTVIAAHAVSFLRGRLSFVPSDPANIAPDRPTENAGAPSMLVAYGEECAAAIARAHLGMTFAVQTRELGGQATLWERAA